MSVVEAVEHDIEIIRRRAPELADGALAASARVLAAQMDGPNSATSKSMCARALIDTLDRLAELAPEADAKDQVDDLTTRRAVRLAGRSAT